MSHSTIDKADRGDYVNRYGPTSARAVPAQKQRLTTPTVDIHAHVAVPEAAAYIAPHLVLSDIAMVRHSNAETKGINMTQDADRKVAMVDMDDRLAVLDAMGIDFQVVAPPPFQCYYSVPLEHAVKGSRMVNEGIAGFVAKRPDRFAGLGTVPLAHPTVCRATGRKAGVRKLQPWQAALKGRHCAAHPTVYIHTWLEVKGCTMRCQLSLQGQRGPARWQRNQDRRCQVAAAGVDAPSPPPTQQITHIIHARPCPPARNHTSA